MSSTQATLKPGADARLCLQSCISRSNLRVIDFTSSATHLTQIPTIWSPLSILHVKHLLDLATHPVITHLSTTSITTWQKKTLTGEWMRISIRGKEQRSHRVFQLWRIIQVLTVMKEMVRLSFDRTYMCTVADSFSPSSPGRTMQDREGGFQTGKAGRVENTTESQQRVNIHLFSTLVNAGSQSTRILKSVG